MKRVVQKRYNPDKQNVKQPYYAGRTAVARHGARVSWGHRSKVKRHEMIGRHNTEVARLNSRPVAAAHVGALVTRLADVFFNAYLIDHEAEAVH